MIENLKCSCLQYFWRFVSIAYMNTRSQRSFKNPDLHPSWHVIIFAIGVIISCIIVNLVRPTTLNSFLWILLAIVIFILAIIIAKKWTVALVIIASFLIIGTRAGPEFVSQDYFKNLVGSSITITGKISKDPTTSESSASKLNIDLVDLKISVSSGNTEILPGHLFAQINKMEIQRSDIISVTGEVSDGFGAYSAAMFRPEVLNISRPEPGDIFLKIRNNFAEHVRQFIPSPESGLGIGFLLGQKSSIDSKIQDALRTVGLTHIIVASGAHLSSLISISRKIFGKLSRFASLLAALLAMLMFLGVTGLSASMLRASLVTGISLVLWYFGRKVHPARLIILVAAATLIYNPFYLTDLSWLLSFASFTGIMILAPMLTKFFYGQKKPGFVSNTLINSVSAALICSPILLFYFGQISAITILANILILPTISIAMGLTFLTGIAAYLIPFAAQILGELTKLLIDYQITIANFFAENKSFLIQIEKNNPLVLLLYIPIIVTFCFCARKAHQNKQTQYTPAALSP